MTVQLAPIRPHDLRAGDVLIDVRGFRYKLTFRGAYLSQAGWHTMTGSFIADVDIERTGPHRIWWLDEAADR